MAKKRSLPTRKAKGRSVNRKEKVYEVDGHQLTVDMYLRYQQRLESRQATNRNDSPAYQQHLALEDMLAEYQISHTSKRQLRVLGSQIVDVQLALNSLASFPFFSGQDRTTRLAGCDALNRLSEAIYVLGKKVSAISHAIRYEDRGKVQDWIAHQKAIDNISWPPSRAEMQS